MLAITKQFLRDNGYHYKKGYIRPLMTPDNVYVFRFGKDELNNRIIIRYGHGWMGRQKIKEIDLRLHKQKHPRIFKTELSLMKYLKFHLEYHEEKVERLGLDK
ncbi:hypothetical protein EQU06_04545 [Lactobacillus sanfranciscensis]|uniref:Uncharacterized protein n=1 Tax=Fructilactobacillus sanfranciscensis (strain TMW 1.1304) TaxID=714313 RepID=G2KU98_FRUST|nr:hypothetical protein [Fructilactobacillus sanfranciscensis]AEN99207.1 hypothetical protein LSA_07940 [Fructilactobacillus sanfranciscensis TMW 1.1304]NDR75820.1 hypothetical protein [Fructilactobacillus sanfranciscensis]NDR96163.1 hypothetical protein [Fructilactobacillus sanfranciscensis]NDS04632.1 hypothetical protein [Fructilactobacillus sanfranciscensis]POH20496.1 hypothetical protein BGL44_01330 [Fructilactobacillus sanfranciscensis]